MVVVVVAIAIAIAVVVVVVVANVLVPDARILVVVVLLLPHGCLATTTHTNKYDIMQSTSTATTNRTF